MAEQDEIQIKLGISLQGVEASQAKARDVQQRSQIAKREATQAEQTVDRIEHKLTRFGLHGMKTAARAAVIGSLAIAADEFLPHEEEGAWSAISRIGAGAIAGGLYGAMSGNPAAAGAGAVTGAIIATISELERAFKEQEKKVTEIEQKQKEQNDAFNRQQEDVKKELQDIRTAALADEFRQKNQRYLELKSVLGGQ